MVIQNTASPSEIHFIDHENWVPAEGIEAFFSIGHHEAHIYLSYQVEEPQVRAVNTAFNSPVWEDSCVEFFFSPEGEYYYNFEFNAIGTVLCAYGKERHERQHLPDPVLSKVVTEASLGKDPIAEIRGHTSWSLKVRIPLEVLIYNDIKELSGLEARGNFYKCGDKLDHPHYLSWNPVRTPKPDFHLPEHFGKLSFL